MIAISSGSGGEPSPSKPNALAYWQTPIAPEPMQTREGTLCEHKADEQLGWQVDW